MSDLNTECCRFESLRQKNITKNNHKWVAKKTLMFGLTAEDMVRPTNIPKIGSSTPPSLGKKNILSVVQLITKLNFKILKT